MEKYKLLMISDHILSNSGVALQTRHIAEHLLKTGKFKIISISVALHLADNRITKTHEYGDDLIIVPATRYDDQQLIRQILDAEKPDALWIMTDPRFYMGLFAMAGEVKKQCPILWNCIWDNPPTPLYNKPLYDCIDFFGCINKIMYNVTKDMGYGDVSKYIPHGVPESEYKILETSQAELRKKHFGADSLSKNVEFVVFYCSRNALRKRTGNVIMAYKKFLDDLPEDKKDKVFLCMHTPPKDPEGQDLYRFIDDMGLKGKVGISPTQVPTDKMVEYYNMADVTLIQSSEEGFGLSCLESLMCGTPVICGKTGGLQDQIYDPETEETFGIEMNPDATTMLGSQQTPYIFSHHFNYDKTAAHLRTLFDDKQKLGERLYKETWAGTKARESMLRRFNLKNVTKEWEDVIIEYIHKHRNKMSDRTIEMVEI
jgi:glycosyltransferase involved in cell wall biosynthesis